MTEMLTELCGWLKNWFEVEKCYGSFKIVDGHISFADGTELPLQNGQHFRIIRKTDKNDGSVFNDGVYQFLPPEGEPLPDSPSTLKDEEWKGSVWCLAIPNDLIELSEEIAKWQEKNGSLDSAAMSPFNSESFGGYSYSKSSGAESTGGTGWQSVFGNRLARYRKV